MTATYRKLFFTGVFALSLFGGGLGAAQAQTIVAPPPPMAPAPPTVVAPAPPTVVNPPPPIVGPTTPGASPQPYYAPPGTVVYPGGQPYYPPPMYGQPVPPPAYGQPVPPPAYGQPIPPPPPQPVRYEYRRPNKGLLIAGIAILGGSYMLTALPTALWNALDQDLSSAASTSKHGTYWPLYIPVIGPWIELSYLSSNPYYSGWAVLPAIPCVLSGLIQGTGLALTIAGAVTGRRVPVYDTPGPSISFAPIALPGGGGGLGASGRF